LQHLNIFLLRIAIASPGLRRALIVFVHEVVLIALAILADIEALELVGGVYGRRFEGLEEVFECACNAISSVLKFLTRIHRDTHSAAPHSGRALGRYRAPLRFLCRISRLHEQRL
jgi:hypothetical protein